MGLPSQSVKHTFYLFRRGKHLAEKKSRFWCSKTSTLSTIAPVRVETWHFRMDRVVLRREHGLGKGIWETSVLSGWLIRIDYHYGDSSHLIVRLSKLLHPSRTSWWVAKYHRCKSVASAHERCNRVWPTFPQPRAMLIRMTLADNANFDGAGINLNINGSAKNVFLRMVVSLVALTTDATLLAGSPNLCCTFYERLGSQEGICAR